MKLDKAVLLVNAITLGILIATSWGEPGIIGLFSILLGFLNLVIGAILISFTDKKAAPTALLVGGVIILIGFGLCSAFPLFN